MNGGYSLQGLFSQLPTGEAQNVQQQVSQQVASAEGSIGNCFDATTGSLDSSCLAQYGMNAALSIGGVDLKAAAAEIGSTASIGAAIGVLFGGAGAAVGAAVGAIVGAVIAIAPAVESLGGPSCALFIPGPNGVSEIRCSDYPAVVATAMQWVQANTQTASTLDPAAFAVQATILEPNFADWYAQQDAATQKGFKDDLPQLKQLLGARDMLRLVQVPIATALATVTPELLPLYKITFPVSFPALTADDLTAIIAAIQPKHDQLVTNAQAWAQQQPTKPTSDQIHAQFPQLLPVDVDAVAAVPATGAQTLAALKQQAAAGIKLVPMQPASGATSAPLLNLAGLKLLGGFKVATSPSTTASTPAPAPRAPGAVATPVLTSNRPASSNVRPAGAIATPVRTAAVAPAAKSSGGGAVPLALGAALLFFL